MWLLRVLGHRYKQKQTSQTCWKFSFDHKHNSNLLQVKILSFFWFWFVFWEDLYIAIANQTKILGLFTASGFWMRRISNEDNPSETETQTQIQTRISLIQLFGHAPSPIRNRASPQFEMKILFVFLQAGQKTFPSPAIFRVLVRNFSSQLFLLYLYKENEF